VTRIAAQLIKEKTYRYRDGSVPFLRNIRIIGGTGSYLEQVEMSAEAAIASYAPWPRIN
jgi:hypothetical protein